MGADAESRCPHCTPSLNHTKTSPAVWLGLRARNNGDMVCSFRVGSHGMAISMGIS